MAPFKSDNRTLPLPSGFATSKKRLVIAASIFETTVLSAFVNPAISKFIIFFKDRSGFMGYINFIFTEITKHLYEYSLFLKKIIILSEN